MRSILILTDFSEAAFRAAEYAAELAATLQVKRIILYHAYQTIVVGGADLPAAPINTQRLYLDSMESLGLVQDRLKSLVGQEVKIDMLAQDTSFLPDMINQLCEKEKIGLVVMGVSGKSGVEKLLIGSITGSVLKSVEFPALIVPNETVIGKGIKSIVLCTDLKDLGDIPSGTLYEILDAFSSELHIVNVLPESKEGYSTETEKSITKLHQNLEKYHPFFHYLQGEDTVSDILSFAEEHQASLIIVFPKKHGFFSSIFHKSVSKKLAYNSSVPLLSLPGL
ncbi:MAG TPA: universal stress protein [Chitinophagaceae bacterium]|nr:universal stress protein [Chitinophagaceae bacterium]